MNRALKPLCALTLAAVTVSQLGAGCSRANDLPRTALAVTPRLATQGRSIYFGEVFPLYGSAPKPTFVYERRVAARGAELLSTHVTRSLDGAVALAEEATHSRDYGLKRYELHTNQRGQRGSVSVEHGDVHFHLIDGGREEAAVEHGVGSPVVVGPTLVGYIFEHLAELRAGKTFNVRLAVLDRLETLGFDLESVSAAAGHTRVRMRPSSFFVRLAIDPIFFTFESASGKLVRLEGRVPSKRPTPNGLEDFDARVEYHFVADRYL
jgi:hypothetical protein